MNRLQRTLRVVKAGVNHATVARAGGHTQPRQLLEKEDILPAARECASDGAADHAAADNQDPRLFHTYENKAGSPFLEGRPAAFVDPCCLPELSFRRPQSGAGSISAASIRWADGKFNGILLHDFASIFPG